MDNGILASVQIMFIGMAVVIIFLIIMVYIMKFVSLIVAQIDKIMPQKEEEIASSVQSQPINNDKTMAIAVALAHIHSNSNKKR